MSCLMYLSLSLSSRGVGTAIVASVKGVCSDRSITCSTRQVGDSACGRRGSVAELPSREKRLLGFSKPSGGRVSVRGLVGLLISPQILLSPPRIAYPCPKF